MRSPQNVLATIPGWQGARWVELPGGKSNNAFHVIKDDMQGVLKIDQIERGKPVNTRRDEAAVQSAAARAGLAAPVLYFDSCTYLTEYVDGVVWRRSSFDQEGNLARVAAALKRLHALPLSGQSFDAKTAARRYAEKIDNRDIHLFAMCMQVIEELAVPQELVCCHNDLVVENMIVAPDLLFLDWEYACDNDPVFDLATVVEHHELSEQQVTQLLNAYFDGDGHRQRSHLAVQQKLYLALLWLWLSHRSDSNAIEIERVTARLVTSCS